MNLKSYIKRRIISSFTLRICLSSLLAAIRKFRGRDVSRKRSLTTRREERRLYSLAKLSHLCLNTWIRLLWNSHTTILPSLRIAVENGFFNSPLPLPSLPNFVTNFPLSSNTWTLWFALSQITPLAILLC